MKILFLTDGIHPFVLGGMQKHSLNLAQELAANGHEISLVHCGGKDYSSQKFRKLFNDSENKKIQETVINFQKSFRFPGHYLRESRNYSKQIYSHFAKVLSNFDLIYAQGLVGHYFIKAKKLGWHNVPLVVNLHGLEMFQFAPNLKVRVQYIALKKEARYNLKNADWVYSFGGKLDAILEKNNVAKNRILSHSNGVSSTWAVIKPTHHAVRTFLFIGRNERRKGLTELTQALKKLLENNDLKFNFYFIGPIENEIKINDSRIKYFGEIRDQEEVKQIIDQCDCLVCPSYAEGMPTVILEAMARGLAIIATNVGAVSEQINGNGILIEKPDIETIQKAIRDVCDLSESDLNNMKIKSMELVQERFLWTKVAASKIGDFKRIISKID